MTRKLIGAVFLLLLPSCANDDWSPSRLAHGEGHSATDRENRGRASYSTYCAGCHGEQGDGNGGAARFLSPKPRDFRKGRLKFASVSAGSVPRDDDFLKTITHGLSGTSMPAWTLLPLEERQDIVAYIRSLGPPNESPAAAVPIPPDPFVKRPEKGVEEGERLYHGLAACTSCHPAYASRERIKEHMQASDVPFSGFRERLYESETKESEWGEPIKPPDFLEDRVKSGNTRDELVRVIAAGVGGTAMPSWGESLKPKQLWGLAYYVHSLVALRGTDEARALTADLLGQPTAQAPSNPR